MNDGRGSDGEPKGMGLDLLMLERRPPRGREEGGQTMGEKEPRGVV